MDFLIKFIAGIISAALVAGVSIISMIWGWGVTPENWGVIILTYAILTVPTAVSGVMKL